MDGCALPYKIFAKTIVAQLNSSAVAADFTAMPIQYAVGEVLTAAYTEALQLRQSEDNDGALELHSSSEASWKGTKARGNGIAMDLIGKNLIAAAAARLTKQLSDLAQMPSMVKLGAAP